MDKDELISIILEQQKKLSKLIKKGEIYKNTLLPLIKSDKP